MKYPLVLFAFILAGVAGIAQTPVRSFVPGTPADEAAIHSILALEETGDRSRLPMDLDWENAFGIRYSDEKKRAAFYHAAVDPLQAQSNRVTLETRIKFIAPTIAVADVYGRRVGQTDIKTGKPSADRWLRNTYVFKKENGVWSEVVERIADLRLPWYQHYDAMPVAYPVPAAVLASYAGRYQFASGRPVEDVSVAGDHLLSESGKGRETLVPTSATEFLAFHPDDLAQYLKITFGADASEKMNLSIADVTGETVATGVKAK